MLLLLPSCQRSGGQEHARHEIHGSTMGTTYSVVINNHPKKIINIEYLKRSLDERLIKINDIFSTYIPHSTISRFNKSLETKAFVVEPEFVFVAQRALEIGRLTEGAFNIALDPLINLWGFDRTGRINKKPEADKIQEALRLSNPRHLEVQKNALIKASPHLAINLSGIAKGWAVDELARLMEKQGFDNFLVEIGGEIVARGKNPHNRSWRIGIEDPRFVGQEKFIAQVNLSNKALASSGNYLNFFVDSDGQRFHHILDPRTGYPSKSDIISVSVIANDCISADAMATAALILGEQGIKKIGLQDVHFMFVRANNDRLLLSFVGAFEEFMEKS